MPKPNTPTSHTTETIDLVINDESIVNDRGYNVLNAGLDRTRYDINPVLLYDHDTWQLIGRCEGMRVEGSKLIGSFVFDTASQLAAEKLRQIKDGFLRGVSAGFCILHMLFDQEHDTVDKWELYEVSVVTLPSNKGAVKLYAQDGRPLSPQEETQHIEQLRSVYTTNTNTNMPNTQNPTQERVTLSAEAMTALGVSQAASSDELSHAVLAMSKELTALKTTLETQRVARRDELINQALAAGKITAQQKQVYSDLYDANPQLCCDTLAALPARRNIADQLHTTPTVTVEGDWDTLDKQGKLATLKAQDPDKFRALFKAKFGVDYRE